MVLRYKFISITNFLKLEFWIKSCAVGIVISFILPHVAWTLDAVNYTDLNINQTKVFYRDQMITIPNKYGMIQEGVQGQDKIIISIQDLHCNYEAQKNIAAIIKFLNKKYNVKLIGEEGAVDKVDTTMWRSFPLSTIREQVADFFVKQGKLTGAEYLAITHEKYLDLYGIETDDLYNESLAIVRDFLNAETQGLIFDLYDSLEQLKLKVFNQKLLTYDKLHQQYNQGALNVISYIKSLRRYAEKYHIDLEPYAEFIKSLSIKNTLFSHSINADQLEYEMRDINQQIYRHLTLNKSESHLIQLSKNLVIIEKLLSISVNQDELAEFRQQRSNYNTSRFITFINQLEPEISLEIEMSKLDQYLKKVEDFYELADQRSQIFVENLLTKMDQHNESIAVMINGGFHNNKIVEELNKQGIGHVVIKPNVTDLDVVNPYFSLLQGKKLPIEKLLEKNQNILAMKSWLQTTDVSRTVEMAFDPQVLQEIPNLSSLQRRKINKWLSKYNIISVREIKPSSKQVGQLPDELMLCEATIDNKEPAFPVIVTKQHAFSRPDRNIMATVGGALAARNVMAFPTSNWQAVAKVSEKLNAPQRSVVSNVNMSLKQSFNNIFSLLDMQITSLMLKQLIIGDFQGLIQRVTSRSGKVVVVFAAHFLETGFVVIPIIALTLLPFLIPIIGLSTPVIITFVAILSLLWIYFSSDLITEKRHQRVLTKSAHQTRPVSIGEKPRIKRDFRLQGMSAMVIALVLTQQPSLVLESTWFDQLIASVILGLVAYLMATTIHGFQSVYEWYGGNGLRMGGVPTDRTDVMLTYLAGEHDEQRIDEPLSISVLAGYLEKSFEGKLKIATNHYKAHGVDGILKQIEEERPRVLGLSLFYQSLPDMHRIMEKVRDMPIEYRPQVVLGNAIAANDYQWLLQQYPEVLVCFGEGEQTMVDVVHYINGDKSITDIANIAYSNKQHQIKRSKPPAVTDMSQLGLPRRDILSQVVRTKGIVNLEITRDCHFNCAICARTKIFESNKKRKPRFRTLEDIITDIITVCESGVTTVNFVDEDLLSAPPNWILELAKRIKYEKDVGKIPRDFSFFTSVSVRSVFNPKPIVDNENTIREQALNELREAGLSFVFIGIESGSPRQLKRYGKYATVEDNRKAIEILDKLGIGITPGFIMFDPKVTLAELKKNIAFLRNTGIANKIGYVIKNYIPLRNARTTQNLIRQNLVDNLDYDPNYGAYEWFFADKDAAQVFYAIKEWEESQHEYLWQLKLIRRGTDFNALSVTDRTKILEWINHENDFMLNFLEALVQDESSQNHEDIIERYSNLWIQHVINVDITLREYDSMSTYQDKLRSSIYDGIIREYIRRHEVHRRISRSQLIDKISSRYSNIDLTQFELAFDRLVELNTLHDSGFDNYSVNNTFWDFKKVTFHERPRPWLGMAQEDMVKLRTRIGVKSAVRIGHEFPVSIGASRYWYIIHDWVRKYIFGSKIRYDYKVFQKQAHWVENNYIWLLISIGLVTFTALTTGDWQSLLRQLLSFDMINDVKLLSMAGWLSLFLGAHFNKGTPVPNQVAAVKITGLIILAHMLPLPFIMIVPWASYRIHTMLNQSTFVDQQPIINNSDLKKRFDAYLQSFQNDVNESPYDPIVGQTLEKFKNRLFGQFDFMNNLNPKLGSTFSLKLIKTDQLTLEMPRWAWQLFFSNSYFIRAILKAWLNWALWSMYLDVLIGLDNDPVIIHHQVMLSIQQQGPSDFAQAMAKISNAVASHSYNELTGTEKLIAGAYKQVIEKQDYKSRQLLMLRLWRLIQKQPDKFTLIHDLQLISFFVQHVGGFKQHIIKINYEDSNGKQVIEQLRLPQELLGYKFILETIKIKFRLLNIYYDRLPKIPRLINLFRMLNNSA